MGQLSCLKGIRKWTREKLLVSLPWKTRGHGLRAAGRGHAEPCTVRAAVGSLHGAGQAPGRLVTAPRSGPSQARLAQEGPVMGLGLTPPRSEILPVPFPTPALAAAALQHRATGDREPATAPRPGESWSGCGVPTGCCGARRSLAQPGHPPPASLPHIRAEGGRSPSSRLCRPPASHAARHA